MTIKITCCADCIKAWEDAILTYDVRSKTWKWCDYMAEWTFSFCPWCGAELPRKT